MLLAGTQRLNRQLKSLDPGSKTYRDDEEKLKVFVNSVPLWQLKITDYDEYEYSNLVVVQWSLPMAHPLTNKPLFVFSGMP